MEVMSKPATEINIPELAVAEICRRYEIRELYLFGSAVRGEMRPDSDIDLLVDFLPGAKVSLLRHFAAERELTELLGRRVDLVSKRALREPLRKEILPQARLLYAA
jgi:predicted nucleotidyltransferase